MNPLLTHQIRRSHSKTVTMVTLVIITGGVWLFLEITNLAMQQKTLGFDQQVLLALRQSDTPSLPLGPAGLVNVVRDVTALVGYTLLTLLTVIVSLYLGLKRKLSLMLLSLITITGGAAVSSTLICFLVGASRVYLGVHFPTDVIAGWTAGSVWVMVCFLVAGHIGRYPPDTSLDSSKISAEYNSRFLTGKRHLARS